MTEPITTRRSASAAEAAAALARAADGATEELAVLHAEVAARDAELERLQDICDDRQRVIEELSEHATTYRRAAEERAGLVAAIDFDIQRLRGDLDRAERQRTDALAAAEAATFALDEERQRARLLAGEHEAALRAAHHEAERLRAHAGVLEEALASRQRMVDELQTACAARLGVIEQLSGEIGALREIAEERRVLLEENQAQYRELQAAAERARADGETTDDGVDWRAVAEDRERALQDVSAEAERRAVLLAELTAALEGRTREVEDLRKRLTRAS